MLIYLIQALLFESKDNIGTTLTFDLLYGKTYRYPLLNGVFSMSKGYLRSLFDLFQNPIRTRPAISAEIVGLDHFNERWDTSIRLEYLATIAGKSVPIDLINKTELAFYLKRIERVALILIFLLIMPLLIIFFHKRKGKVSNMALFPLIVAEMITIRKILEKSNVRTVYYFNSYEFDANLVAKMLMEMGVSVIKIPSPNPLSYEYKHIHCTELILTSRYQKDELEFGKVTTSGKISFWVPENSSLYLSKYLLSRKTEKFIGYYSSANWLRVGTENSEIKSARENDEVLLMKLDEIARDSRYTLKIFLHPREKIYDNVQEIKDYYSSILSTEIYEIDSFSLAEVSACKLNEVDIAITPLTTLFFERIFCGFKSIMILNDTEKFPLKSSPLANICIDNLHGLQKLISESLELSNDEFFKKHALTDYHLNGLDSKMLQIKFTP